MTSAEGKDGIWAVDEFSGALYNRESGLMNEENAARYLSTRLPKTVSARTLRRWRHQGQGPQYSKTGRCAWYPRGSLEEWLHLGSLVDPLEDAA